MYIPRDLLHHIHTLRHLDGRGRKVDLDPCPGRILRPHHVLLAALAHPAGCKTSRVLAYNVSVNETICVGCSLEPVRCRYVLFRRPDGSRDR